jgi:pilus assembly protein CpaF
VEVTAVASREGDLAAKAALERIVRSYRPRDPEAEGAPDAASEAALNRILRFGATTGIESDPSSAVGPRVDLAEDSTEPAGNPAGSSDAAMEVKARIHQRVIAEIDIGQASDADSERVRSIVQQLAMDLMKEDAELVLSEARMQELGGEIVDDVLGLGPLEPLLDDPSVSEVMVNTHQQVYFERDGKLLLSDRTFRDEAQVMQVADRILTPLGRRIDEQSPMADARLPDGSRVNIIIPPLAVDGPIITIRKFSKDPLTIEKLIEYGSLTGEIAEFLDACVTARLNVLVSGGTGTGKTTMLNALSSFVSGSERIVTIEDPAEMQLQQPHVVRLETRPPSVLGTGAITQRELVKNALRMRPDRILVGEVRGGEAFDMLQAMNTGHEGSMTTVHANTPRDALARIQNMVMMAGLDLPERAIKEQVVSAIDIVIQLSRLADGTRKVTHVTELAGLEGETVSLQDIFVYERRGIGEDGVVQGELAPTGLVPTFSERLRRSGVQLPPALFQRQNGFLV